MLRGTVNGRDLSGKSVPRAERCSGGPHAHEGTSLFLSGTWLPVGGEAPHTTGSPRAATRVSRACTAALCSYGHGCDLGKCQKGSRTGEPHHHSALSQCAVLLSSLQPSHRG